MSSPEAKLQCSNSCYLPDWEHNQFMVWVVDLTRINSADLEPQLTISQKREHIPFSLSTVDAAPIKDLTPDCRDDEKVISCHFFGEPPLFCQARGPKMPLSNSGQQWPSAGNGVKKLLAPTNTLFWQGLFDCAGDIEIAYYKVSFKNYDLPRWPKRPDVTGWLWLLKMIEMFWHASICSNLDKAVDFDDYQFFCLRSFSLHFMSYILVHLGQLE